MKKNLKNKMKKMVAGMMLVCSLLTLFGGVSSDGIVPYGETVIDGVQWQLQQFPQHLDLDV